jgi:ribose transport system permease protein
MRVKSFFKNEIMIVVLILLCVIFGIINPNFVTPNNLLNICTQQAYMIIATSGIAMVMISGGTDLSVGNAMSVIGVIVSICLTQAMLPTPVAIIIGVIVGIGLGAFNGFISNLFNIHPMIISLATMTMYSGISYTVSNSQSYYGFPEDFMMIGQGKVGPISVPIIIFIIVVVVLSFVLNKTCFGRFIYAVGGNPEAAHLAGINVKRTKLLVFVIAGALFALADIVLISRGGSANSNMATQVAFDGITACVLGGVSFIGGAGKIRGALVGCLILGILSNGMQLAGMGVYAQDIVKGAILIVSIAIDTFQQNAKTKVKKAA